MKHRHEAGDGLGGAVSVECAQHKMAGQGGLYADTGRLRVTNFPDHDNVRVGAQKRAQGRGKVKTDLGIHVDLTQTGLRDFHRVFCGPQLGRDRS